MDEKIKRCGEMARKLRFFKDQMSKAGVSPKEFLGKDVDIDLDDVEVNGGHMPCFYFLFASCLFFSFFLSPFQVKLGELEAELSEINANNDKLQRSYNELMEYKLVLEKVYILSFFTQYL